MAFVNEELSDFDYRTIDKERGIILTKLEGGRSEYPFRFRLEMSDRAPVEFQAYRKFFQDEQTVIWSDVKVFAPVDESLKEIIIQALKRRGFAASDQWKDNTQVVFSNKLNGD